jgi:hypothetical protein
MSGDLSGRQRLSGLGDFVAGGQDRDGGPRKDLNIG